MTNTDNSSRIIERFLEDCPPAEAREPLAFLTFDTDVRACPSEPAAVVATLCDEFPVDDLVASGVVETAADSSVQLTPGLSTPGEMLIVLRDAETNAAFDLLTSAGNVSKRELAVFASLRDAHTGRCLDNGNRELFVACNVEDAAVLRACGLPATLPHGLDVLPLDQVDQFCASFGLSYDRADRNRRFDIDRDGNDEPTACPADDPGQCSNPRTPHAQTGTSGAAAAGTAASHPPQSAAGEKTDTLLVFVGWAPSSLARAMPVQLNGIVEYFKLLAKHMGVDMDDLGLWEPSMDEMERLQFIARGGCRGIFQEALLDSAVDVDGRLVEFGAEPRQSSGPPTDYTAALSRLYAASSSDGHFQQTGPDNRKRAWGHVQRLLEQQVIQPLRASAMTAGDPVRQSLFLCIAELSHVFHTQSVLITEKLNRKTAQNGIDNAEPLPAADLKNLLNMADRLIDLAKATNPCRQPKPTIVPAHVIESPTTPRLPHSG